MFLLNNFLENGHLGTQFERHFGTYARQLYEANVCILNSRNAHRCRLSGVDNSFFLKLSAN